MKKNFYIMTQLSESDLCDVKTRPICVRLKNLLAIGILNTGDTLYKIGTIGTSTFHVHDNSVTFELQTPMDYLSEREMICGVTMCIHFS